MTTPSPTAPHASRWRLVPVGPRDPHEPGRTATTLELFFDLVFVIAVAIAGVQLHHALAEAHVVDGIVSYLMVFFAIWWSWMNFTWFATSFATDDWLYRVLTFVQMGGVLVFAAGIAPIFEEGDFTLGITAYIIMRLALVAQWLRASRCGGAEGRAARWYAGGLVVVQLLWVGFLLLVPPALAVPFFLLFALAELAVPVIAENRGRTPWHAHHIAERYGLFTIILLGESLLGSANAVIDALHEGDHLAELIPLAVLGFVVTCSLWWIYFWPAHHRLIGADLRASLRYGYGHFVIFAAAGALAAGLELQIDVLTGHSGIHDPWASLAFSVPIAVFMLAIWALAYLPVGGPWVNVAVPTAAVLVLIDPVLPVPLALSALFLIAVVVVLEWRRPYNLTADDVEHERLDPAAHRD